MTICYFGIYNPNHSRNRLNIKGLRQNGVTVLECNTRDQSFRKYWQLIRRHFSIRNQYDVMVVGFPGHPVMPLAWLLARLSGKKIIFDAFISLYDSFVFDEKKYSPGSFQAYKYWFLDWLSCVLSDRIVLEAGEYAKYFQKTFRIPEQKFRRAFVTCDDEIMFPRPKPETRELVIHFHGTYIPAQGIEYIMDAAEILKNENIRFNLAGRLKDYEPMIQKAKTRALKVNFFDFMPYERLADMIATADLCLGMFGDTEKAKRAGAFKIMEAMAMKKPIITADTPAVREFLVDGQNALLCRIADAEDLAEKILRLKADPQLRDKLAKNGYEDFQKSMTPKSIGRDLLQIAGELA